MILERLDRGFANEGWLSLYPYSWEEHLITSKSDHAPILIQVSNKQKARRTVKKPFRFENMWVRNGGCDDLVKEF